MKMSTLLQNKSMKKKNIRHSLDHHSEPQLLQCHCLWTFLENSPHIATEPAFDRPLILLMLVLLQVGQWGTLLFCSAGWNCVCRCTWIRNWFIRFWYSIISSCFNLIIASRNFRSELEALSIISNSSNVNIDSTNFPSLQQGQRLSLGFLGSDK